MTKKPGYWLNWQKVHELAEYVNNPHNDGLFLL